MVERKESTPTRESRRRYEEKNKEKRREKSGNFQTMIPKAEYEEITAFLRENHITKVQFIRKAYELLKTKYTTESSVVPREEIGVDKIVR